MALGNGGGGVALGLRGNTANNNTIVGNLISGNAGDGVSINGSGNVIQGNLIGIDATGSKGLANSGRGVYVNGSSNTIGGTGPGVTNLIAYNGKQGVDVASGTGNAILVNAIFANGTLGIDLGDNGVTPNDSQGHTGPNNYQNFPVLTSVSPTGSTTTVTGTLSSTANATFRIEFFVSPSGDPSGYGQGAQFLGFTIVTTDGTGIASFTATLATRVSAGQFITATATDPNNNTSEFSAWTEVKLSGNGLNASEGASFTGRVATFVGSDLAATTGNFTATIDWGDGSTSPGSITQPGGTGTAFQVTANHAYAEEGPFAITVTVHDIANNLDSTVTSTADLADSPLWDFRDPSGFIGAGSVNPQNTTKAVVLVNAGSATSSDAVLALDPITGQTAVRYSDPTGSFASWTGPSDQTFVGDVDNSGVSQLIQIHRAAVSGTVPSNGFIRFVNLSTGITEQVINYSDFIPGTSTTYAQLMGGMVDPEDVVLVGHFTQNRSNPGSHLEALFFNRTTQARNSTALLVLDLVTGQETFSSLHDGNIFSGWLDPHDDVFASDTNNDGYDDLVLVNRVPDPQNFEKTNKGFVGMVSIHDLGAPPSPCRGFYRFFAWNYAGADNRSVFPGYDDQNDHATGGLVVNNGVPTPVILLINSQYEVDSNGNPVGAAYAVLQPAPLLQGVPDSFQLISTIMQNQVQVGTFAVGDSWFMADLTGSGSGSDQVVSFSRGSNGYYLSVFDALKGTLITQVPKATTQAPTGLALAVVSQRGGSVHALLLQDTISEQASALAAAWQSPGSSASSSEQITVNRADSATPSRRMVRSNPALTIDAGKHANVNGPWMDTGLEVDADEGLSIVASGPDRLVPHCS